VLHGTHDSLASVGEARLFVERLRAVSETRSCMQSCPAQHAWK
jgi:hypothetical protein